jgi:hypothetical protein
MSTATRSLTLAALMALVSAPRDVQAQNAPITLGSADTGLSSRIARRFSGSAGALQMRPVGEFRQYVGLAYGVGGNALFRLDDRGIFSLRADLGWLGYGRESKRVPLSPTVGGRVMVDVETTNQILLFTVGPQFAAPSGFLRPYVGASGGLTHFFTTSGVNGASDEWDFARTENFHSTKLSWIGNAGAYVPLRIRRLPIMLDLGVTYVDGGQRSYLRRGSIIDNADGTIQLNPVHSDTQFLTYRVGVRFGS